MPAQHQFRIAFTDTSFCVRKAQIGGKVGQKYYVISIAALIMNAKLVQAALLNILPTFVNVWRIVPCGYR